MPLAPFHARLRTLGEQAQDQPIADLGVVDEQLLLGLLDETAQDLARRLRADHELVVAGCVGLPGAVGLEQRGRLFDEPRLGRNDAEAAALLDVELRVIEAEHVQRVVNEQHLSVVPRKIIGRPSDRHAGVEQAQFELPENLFAAAVRVRDERADHDATRDRRLERFFELGAVEPENDDIDGLLRAPDRLHKGGYAVVRLDDELHFLLVFFSDQSTAAWPSLSSSRIVLVMRSVCTSNGTCTS